MNIVAWMCRDQLVNDDEKSSEEKKMYLSRLILNPRSRAVQRDLASPYDLHRTVMSGFPEDLGKHEDRVLYRLDQMDYGKQLSPAGAIATGARLDSARFNLPGAGSAMDNPEIKQIELPPMTGQRLHLSSARQPDQAVVPKHR
jgi:hypothetical protein